MVFYQPRANRTTQFQTVRANQQQGGNIQRGSTATSQTPQQSDATSTGKGMLDLYRTGKMGSDGIDKAATLYDRFTMPSGVNSAGEVSPMYDTAAANADFMGGGEATFPQGYQTAQAADNAAFMGSGEAGGGLAPTAVDATAYNSGNIGLLGGAADGGMAAGTDAAATAATDAAATTALEGAATDAAATTALEGAATTAATEGAGVAAAEGAGTAALGAEAGALGALGPIGLAAGIGLLGTKLFGLW